MQADINLTRFIEAQTNDYDRALAEIKRGRKQSHWMWYIFPQLKGLGHSSTAIFYGLDGLREAIAYVDHPILGPRLIDIAAALLQLEGKTATQIMGTPDDMKLRSSMTLFSLTPNANPVFQAVLDNYFDGLPDPRTQAIVEKGD
jgi:uncharacterized protein (DUF1810 family)